DVSGSMFYDLVDTCDGFAVQQQLKLVFTFPEGEGSTVTSSVVTWEARDGSSFRFNVKRETDGRQDMVYKGVVMPLAQGAQERVVRYSVPFDREDGKIGKDDLFPTAHAILLLEKALAGEKMFSRRVFDGSDEQAGADISAFIGKRADKMTAPEIAKVTKTAADRALLNEPAWSVRLAFYKPQTQTGEPDYETDLVLLQNGITRSMRIDYGEFSIKSSLVLLEAGERLSCDDL
ncbi:MAG: cell envelope integrity EipB family protein, partial [Alphaproteobacteria bacterium]|nr:cell envelope integrity EipB family protein [Alphaproteobacteria bacterium]